MRVEIVSVIPFGLGVDQHRVYDRGDTKVHHVEEQGTGTAELTRGWLW